MTVAWSQLITLVSLLLTAWYYVNMLHLTRHLQQANTLSNFHGEYSAPRIFDAFEMLEDFFEENNRNPELYAKAFLQLRRSKDLYGREVDRARRLLVHWFSRLEYFYEFGFITKSYLMKFPGKDRSEHFIILAEPLEYVNRISTARKHSNVFQFLRILYAIPWTLPTDFLKDYIETTISRHGILNLNANKANAKNRRKSTVCKSLDKTALYSSPTQQTAITHALQRILRFSHDQCSASSEEID